MPALTPTTSSPLLRTLITVLALVVAAVAGYFAVYSWTYYQVGNWFRFPSFKSQVLIEQKENSVASQLESLGFSPEEVNSLNEEGTSTYRANVLDGFDPSQAEEAPGTPGYYFYDASGEAYYLELDADGQVIQESITPLIRE